jgi:hypothetical protein
METAQYNVSRYLGKCPSCKRGVTLPIANKDRGWFPAKIGKCQSCDCSCGGENHGKGWES